MKTTFRTFKLVLNGKVIDLTTDIKSLPLICKWKNVEPIAIRSVEHFPHDMNDSGVWQSVMKDVFISVEPRGWELMNSAVKIPSQLLKEIKLAAA